MREINVGSFGGLDTRDDLGKWANDGATYMLNCSIKDGRLFPRPGYAKINTTSTDKDRVIGVFQLSDDAGVTQKIYCSADDGSAVIQDGESGMAVIKTGQYPHAFYEAAELNGQLFLANGINHLQQIDGGDCYKAGIDAPTAAATFNSNVNGALTQSATFYFKYTYYNSKLGKEGNSSPASAAMTAGGSSSTDGIKINIPLNASLDAQIDAVRVYRTKAGGTLYFFDQEVAYSGSAITVDSVQADDGLTSTQAPYAGASADIASDYSVPPITQNAISFGGVLWLMGTYTHSVGNVNVTSGSATVGTGATSPQFHVDMAGARFRVEGDDRDYEISVVASATSLTLAENYAGTTGSDKTYYIYRNGSELSYCLFEDNTSKPSAFPTSNKEYIPEIPNIIGAKVISNYMIVWGRNRAHRIGGAYGAWDNRVLSEKHGLAGHMAKCVNRDGLVVFYTGADIKVTDGVTVAGMGTEPVLPYIRDYINHERDEFAHMIYDGINSKVKLFFSSRGSDETDMVLEYSETFKLWTLARIRSTCSGELENIDTGTRYVAFGDSFGFVYEDESGANYGAGSSGTKSGTATAAGTTSLTDSAATFNTYGDGLKGVSVCIFSGKGAGQTAVIQSNTGTVLTVDAWSAGIAPDTTSKYIVGGIDSVFYSKEFDFDDQTSIKRVLDCTITHAKGTANSMTFSTLKEIAGAGTIAVTNGSASVVGSGTSFLSLFVGTSIRINNEFEEYYIAAIASNTGMTLSRPYAGATASGLSYLVPCDIRAMNTTLGTETRAFPHVRAKHFAFRIGNNSADKTFKIYSYTARNAIATPKKITE